MIGTQKTPASGTDHKKQLPTLGEVLIAMAAGKLTRMTKEDYYGWAGAGDAGFLGELNGFYVVLSDSEGNGGLIEIYDVDADYELAAQYVITAAKI